tara:strand:- start:57 stop:314 length:258 start_codon:yes stop_codon:yes gene_type:complete
MPSEHVGVDLSSAQIIVAQKLLYGPNVGAILQQVSGKRMSERMSIDFLAVQAGLPDCNGKEFAHNRVMQVMTAQSAIVRVSAPIG